VEKTYQEIYFVRETATRMPMDEMRGHKGDVRVSNAEKGDTAIVKKIVETKMSIVS
jgi:hypothetical protein